MGNNVRPVWYTLYAVPCSANMQATGQGDEMISCNNCGFGHATSEELAACKPWAQIVSEAKARGEDVLGNPLAIGAALDPETPLTPDVKERLLLMGEILSEASHNPKPTNKTEEGKG